MKDTLKNSGWRKLFTTQEGEFVVGQKPNLPAWIWIGSTAAAYIFEPLAEIFMAIAYGAGAVWAYLEMTSGVNTFRRILGIVVLVAILAVAFGSLYQ